MSQTVIEQTIPVSRITPDTNLIASTLPNSMVGALLAQLDKFAVCENDSPSPYSEELSGVGRALLERIDAICRSRDLEAMIAERFKLSPLDKKMIEANVLPQFISLCKNPQSAGESDRSAYLGGVSVFQEALMELTGIHQHQWMDDITDLDLALNTVIASVKQDKRPRSIVAFHVLSGIRSSLEQISDIADLSTLVGIISDNLPQIRELILECGEADRTTVPGSPRHPSSSSKHLPESLEEMTGLFHVNSAVALSSLLYLGGRGAARIPELFSMSTSDGELKLMGAILTISPDLIQPSREADLAKVKGRISKLGGLKFSPAELAAIVEINSELISGADKVFEGLFDRLNQLKFRIDRFSELRASYSPIRTPKSWNIRAAQSDLRTELSAVELAEVRESTNPWGNVRITKFVSPKVQSLYFASLPNGLPGPLCTDPAMAAAILLGIFQPVQDQNGRLRIRDHKQQAELKG